ncbi:radical SAM protein [Candidatus Magnetomonas plexicatena]|uniref:radical SAM protein n=1 Tax=Candidatus Magnetomonas plexicatena TaxID=2552947 RepID=UPI001C753131|nr:radical SAM protein [Nitrospirales bacterium LBB_01]
MLKVWGFDGPFYLQWHITEDCNLNCIHCYREKRNIVKPEKSDLIRVLKNFNRFLKSINKCGRIQISGGEPLLSEHLFSILAEAKKCGYPVRVLSNGTLVSRDLAKRLNDSGCRIVQVSFEGSEEIHDKIRGVGSFRKALEGAKILHDENIDVTVMMTVSDINYQALTETIKLTSPYVRRFAFSRLVPWGSAKTLTGSILSAKQVKGLFKEFYKLDLQTSDVDVAKTYRDPLWQGYFGNVNPLLLGGCSIGYNGICVDTDGTVYPCRRLPLSLGNVHDMDLTQIWKSEILQELRNRDQLKGKCGKCKLRWQCGGCRAIAYAKTGDYMSEDPQCFIPSSILSPNFVGIVKSSSTY